ncbi:MAG: hypothetical protein K8T91_00510 [Planctomycetes bacterium]|nr:hypothetical protein [Planctomycetota bacterium]
MNSKQNDPLDSLLNAWAQGRAAHEPELRDLKSRIGHTLTNEQFLGDAVGVHRSTHRLRGRFIIGFCGGLAASALVVFGLLRWASPRVEHAEVPNLAALQKPPSAALLQSQELVDKSRLLHAVDTEFAGGLEWLAEGGEDVSLAVGRPEVASQRVGLAMRMVLVRRRYHESDWTRVWSTDVVTYSEQVVDSLPGTTSAAVWACVLPDGLISLDCDLSLESPLSARVRFSGLLKSGIPRQVFSIETTDEEYRLYQTVARLSNAPS